MSYNRNRNLTNHPPTDPTRMTMEEVRAYVKALAMIMDEILPAGRERSLAFTKLEESTMWSMAALARNDYDVEHGLVDGPDVVELAGKASGFSGVSVPPK